MEKSYHNQTVKVVEVEYKNKEGVWAWKSNVLNILFLDNLIKFTNDILKKIYISCHPSKITQNPDFTRAYLYGSDFSNSTLSGTIFYQSELAYTNLSYTDLTNANLIQADLISVNFTGANLSNADFSLSYSKNTQFVDIEINENTKFDSCHEKGLLDKIICNLLRKVIPDSPPFYGEFRNSFRDDYNTFYIK